MHGGGQSDDVDGKRGFTPRQLEQYEPPEVLTVEQRRDLEGVMTAAAGDFKIGV